MQSSRSTEDQRQAFLEGLYSNYTELHHQNEEVQERKRRIDYDTYESNAKEIHNLLFSESDAAEKDLGDRATYDRVQSIIKKVVYGRSHQLMHADKGADALHVRVTTLETTIRNQDEVIRQMKMNLSASEEEVCGLLRQLSAKDSDIRLLTSKTNRQFLQLRALERECATLRSDLDTASVENERLGALQRATALTQSAISPYSAKVTDTNHTAKGSTAKQGTYSMSSSSSKAARRKSSVSKKNAPSLASNGPTPYAANSHSATGAPLANTAVNAVAVPPTTGAELKSTTNTSGEEPWSRGALAEQVEASSWCAKTSTTDSPMVHHSESSNPKSEFIEGGSESHVPGSGAHSSHETATQKSGLTAVQTTKTSADRNFIEFQTDLELLVGANRRLEKENSEMRQQLQAMMLDEQIPALRLTEDQLEENQEAQESPTVLDEERIAEAKEAVLANTTADKTVDRAKRIGYILAQAPQSAALMNLQRKVRKCTTLIEMEAATTMHLLDFDAAPVARVDFAQQCTDDCVLSHEGADGNHRLHAPDEADPAAVSQQTPQCHGTENDATVQGSETAAPYSSCEFSGTPWTALSGKLKGHSVFSTEEEYAQDGLVSSPGRKAEEISYLGQPENKTQETGENPTKPPSKGNVDTSLTSLDGPGAPIYQTGDPPDAGLTAAARTGQHSGFHHTQRCGDNDGSTHGAVSASSTAQTVNGRVLGELLNTPGTGASAPHAASTRGATGDGASECASLRHPTEHARWAGFSPEMASGYLGGLKRDLFGIHNLFFTLQEEVSSFFTLLSRLFTSLAAAGKEQASQVQNLVDDVIEEATMNMAKENVLRSFKNKYNIDVERKELNADMTDEEWLAQHLKNIAVDMVEKKIQHFSTASTAGRGVDKEGGQPSRTSGGGCTAPSRADEGGRYALNAGGGKKGSAHGTVEGITTWQAPGMQKQPTTDEADDRARERRAGEGARVAFGTSSYPASGADAARLPQHAYPTGAAAASSSPGGRVNAPPFSFGNDVMDFGAVTGAAEEEEEDRLRLRGQRLPTSGGRETSRRNPLRWYPVANIDTDLSAPVSQGVQKGPNGGARGRLDVMELLRQLQPDGDGGVEDMRPIVYRYVMPSAYDGARLYAKNRIQQNSRFMHSPQFDFVVQEDILPIAQKADDIAKGKLVVDAPLLKAVKELRQEDAKRRKRNAEMLFRRVATNIKMRRLLKQQVYSGNAFSSYLSLLYNRWAANQTQQSRKRAFEETQLRTHLLEACGLSPQQQQSTQGPRTVSSAPRGRQTGALPPLRGSHKGSVRPFSYQKGSSYHFKDVNFLDDRSK